MRLPFLLAGIVFTAGLTLSAGPSPAPANAATPTFTKDVAPILNKACVRCHRDGQIAPMSLLTYESTRPWARAIKNADEVLAMKEAIADAEDLDDVRGGSTITQQVAKNLFLWPGRSYVRKALEVPLAAWIDVVLSKRRILEIYLNVAELGPNGEFGAEAGARRAFGRSARDLSSYQAALLAASLPNPVTRNARSPGPGLRRLAGLYVARAAQLENAANCVLARR